jgi:hypothetical protein
MLNFACDSRILNLKGQLAACCNNTDRYLVYRSLSLAKVLSRFVSYRVLDLKKEYETIEKKKTVITMKTEEFCDSMMSR